MSENERDPKEILAELKQGLDADTVAERKMALEKLRELTYSSSGVLKMLELMALNDRSKAIRIMALEILAQPIYRQIQGRQSFLAQSSRQVIVNEIATWEKEGLLDKTHAKVLRGRYNFDMKPALDKEMPPKPEPEPIKPKPQSIRAKSESKPAKPKRTLAQTLFSETSIKVALYLGAFFVIAAAAIFAAAIEELRLPILFVFTLFFGGSALALKKRLPQPSFTLFIIFSVLLPIDGSVIADQANLSGNSAHLYWFIIYLLVTGIWAFATWFYRSRFFSILTFIALDLAAYNLITSFGADINAEAYLVLFSVVGLLALASAELLKRNSLNIDTGIKCAQEEP